jgi:hypothetical protein
MRFKCVIPSLGRPQDIQSHPLLEYCHVVVVASQLGDYKHGSRKPLDYHVLPEGVTGLAATRNFILDELWAKDEDFVWMIDDDFQFMTYMMNRAPRKFVDPEYMLAVVDHVGTAAVDSGTGLFGFNLQQKPIERIPSRFIGLRGWLSANAMGVIDRSLRFDPTFVVKGDIDMSLQCLFKHRFLWKDLRWHFHSQARLNRGGLVSSRTTESEQAAQNLLNAKWGANTLKRIVVRGDNKKNNYGVDSVKLNIG